MLGHEARLFSRPQQNMQQMNNGSNDLTMMYPMKRLQQDLTNNTAGTGLRLDMNRNPLSFDRQLYENFGKFCQEQTMKMRNNVRNHFNYMPYPTMPFNNLYYRQMPGLDLTGGTQNFAPQQQQPNTTNVVSQRNNVRPNGNWQLDQVSEYCTELLNRDKHYWTDEETTLMLELYEENRSYFNDNKTKKTKVWNVIANIINKKFNTNVNSEQCSQKYRNLKAEFLKVVDPTSADGGAKKFGRHFTQMKRLIECEDRKGGRVTHTSPQNATPATMKTYNNETNPLAATFASLGNHTSPTKQNMNDNRTDMGPNKMADTAPATGQDINHIIKGDVLNAATQVFPNTTDDNLASILTSMHGQSFTSTLLATDIISPTTSSSIDTDSPSSGSLSVNLPSNDLNNSQQVVKNENDEANVSGREENLSYSDELNNIFQEYFETRDLCMDDIEHDQKSNVKCLKRCLDVFQKIVDDKVFE